mgnify:CR=1 FL=1
MNHRIGLATAQRSVPQSMKAAAVSKPAPEARSGAARLSAGARPALLRASATRRWSPLSRSLTVLSGRLSLMTGLIRPRSLALASRNARLRCSSELASALGETRGGRVTTAYRCTWPLTWFQGTAYRR